MSVDSIKVGLSGSQLNMSMGFAKVDIENRLVFGFASLDNIDNQDDIVKADAQMRAFSKFRGNVREMHERIAAGRVVDFGPKQFYDAESDKTYNGVFVTAYVSKGAQSTWEKVLDGTLTGFSIAGVVLDEYTDFIEGKNVRVITELELRELSLVDSPANPLANIFSIQKSEDGCVYKGMATEIKSKNVFYCDTDEIAEAAVVESVDCSACGQTMKNVGWFEDINDDTNKVADIVKKYRAGKGGNTEMETDENVEEVVEEVEAVVEKADDDVETVENDVEEVDTEHVEDEAPGEEEVSEVDSPSVEVEKMIDALKDDINKDISGVQASVEEIQASFKEFAAGVDEKLSDLVKTNGELAEKYNSLAGAVDSLEKTVTAIDGETAVRKSHTDDSVEDVVVEKATSFWGGHFINAKSL